MTAGGFEVRRLAADELERACAHLSWRPRELHERRFAEQAAGRYRYFVAWVDDVAVGHAGLGLPDDRNLWHLVEYGWCGVVDDLFVEPGHRERGIGSALMVAVEAEAVGAGLPALALDTGVDDGYRPARSLYRSMGWVDRGRPFIASSTVPGVPRTNFFIEILTVWRKPLATPTVRRLASGDLDAMNRQLPSWWSGEYGRRLDAQRRGELAMVVAWEGDRPIGRAMVLFPEHEEYSESAAREGCAEIRDVGVAEDHRRRGIGTAMLRALERIAYDRGSERIGLSVTTEEQPARGLYAKLGYHRAHGPFLISARLDTDDGVGLPVGADPVVYLTKSLR